MPKRLSELLRQRALLQEHLAWLDREIAAEQTSNPSLSLGESSALHAASEPTGPAASESGKSTPPPLPGGPAQISAEKILETYRTDTGLVLQHTRKGCILAALAVGAVLLVVAVALYALYARHLGRWW